MEIKVVILAAGKGKRMGAEIQKAMLPLAGKPMIDHLLDAVEKSDVETKPVVVYGHGGEDLVEHVQDRAECVLQDRQMGTAHAVKVTKKEVGNDGLLLVLYGDHPLVSSETINSLVASYKNNPTPVSIAVSSVDDYKGWQEAFTWFGRILRDEDGKIIAIREARDATPEQFTGIKEINPAYYLFESRWFWDHVEQIKPKNAQGEYYLTDMIDIAFQQGYEVQGVKIPIEESVGCNTPEEFEVAEKIFKKRI